MGNGVGGRLDSGDAMRKLTNRSHATGGGQMIRPSLSGRCNPSKWASEEIDVIKHKSARHQRGSLVAVRRPSRDFQVAIRAVAARVGARKVNAAGTPLSVFMKRHAAVFKRARSGSIEIVYQGAEPFVILGAKQFLALVASLERDRAPGDVDFC